MKRDYREDIDWLRAIAVLPVVLFHYLEPPANFGGFIGVDIFFVISGYLITGIIQSEMKDGTFSLTRFYERRVRRLLPALYVMVALCAIPSFHYLLASERAEFFRSIAAVVTFTSNFFFWMQSGYFDHAAVEKPLLHTWSLAVEEQFYLVLPPFVWALLVVGRGNRVVLATGLAALAVVSFGLAVWLMRTDASATAFFMSPPRAWEFLIGGLLAIEGFPVLRNAWAQLAARAVALFALGIPILSLRPGPGYPGIDALLPCVGAAIYIWSGIGVPTQVRGRYSHHHVVRFFGQISYSLYLWHWPLFTFARFSKNNLVLEVHEKIALFALTVAISYLSWRFVEQPFRDRMLMPTRRTAFAAALLASVVLIAGSVAGALLGREAPEHDRVASQIEFYNNYKPEPFYRSGICFNPSGGAFGDDCLKLVPGKTNVLLWGDSLAAHYFHGLSTVAGLRSLNVLQVTQAACMPTFNAAAQFFVACRNAAAQMEAFFHNHKPDLVILSGDWLEYTRAPRFESTMADLRGTIGKLNARGIRVVVLGPPVQFKARLPAMLLRLHLRGAAARADDLLLPDVFSLDAKMKAALPASEKFSYVSVLDVMCPARQCPVTLDGGVPLSWDHAHLTAEGSLLVMGRLLSRLGLGRE